MLFASGISLPEGRMNVLRLGRLTLMLISLGSCATVTRGTDDAWSVSSRPSGARVETTNGFSCPATPCTLRIPRKAMFVATVTKPGYRPATLIVTSKAARRAGAEKAGQALVGGVIGSAVDARSGAALDLTPNPAFVELEAEADPPPAPERPANSTPVP
jgi:hypothetical protein